MEQAPESFAVDLVHSHDTKHSQMAPERRPFRQCVRLACAPYRSPVAFRNGRDAPHSPDLAGITNEAMT